MPFLVKIHQHYPEKEIPPLDNTPNGDFTLWSYGSHARLRWFSLSLSFNSFSFLSLPLDTHTYLEMTTKHHRHASLSVCCFSFSFTHNLTDRGQNTGRPWIDSGSRRGTWACQGAGSPLRLSLLPHPSSSSSSRRCPDCPWQNPRSLSARRAGLMTWRAAGPRIATAGRSNVATSLTYTPEKTQEGRGAASVLLYMDVNTQLPVY